MVRGPGPELLDSTGCSRVGHDGHAFRGVGAQARGVIEVRMGVDDVADRLARDDLLRRLHDRDRSRFALRRVNDDDVIAEFDDDALRAAGHDPDAIGHLLRYERPGGRRLRLPDRGRHVELHRDIRLHVRDRHVEHRVARRPVHDARREAHAAEILVATEVGLVHHVADHRMAQPRLDVLDEVLLVQHAFELDLGRRRHGDDRLLRAADLLDARGGLAGLRRLDEAVRRHPDLRHAAVNRRAEVAFEPCRHGGLADHVPGDAVAHHPDLPQLAEDRLKAAAERRVLDLGAAPVVAQSRRSRSQS